MSSTARMPTGVQFVADSCPPSPEAAALARAALLGDLTVSETVDLFAKHFEGSERVDSFVAALTHFDPRDPDNWVSLGGRAWLREWRAAESPVRVVPENPGGPEDALSMPWMSQSIREEIGRAHV